LTADDSPQNLDKPHFCGIIVDMRPKTRKKAAFFALGVACLLWTACIEPSPLYGIWADNRGNTLSLFEDDTFNARINSNGVTKNYDGNYSILQNSMTLTCTSEELTVVSEWDLRGNMLYLDWPREDGTVASLTLYKISN